jgi:hypothetical protein
MALRVLPIAAVVSALVAPLVPDSPPPRAQTPAPALPTNVAPQPGPGSGLTLRPAPVFLADYVPTFVVQGGSIRLFGTFAPGELVVTFGSPPVRLAIVERSAATSTTSHSSVVVQFPPELSNTTGPLQARHGTTGASTVVTPALKILPTPRVVSFRPVGSIPVNVDATAPDAELRRSTFEVAVADFDPSVSGAPRSATWPILEFPGCATYGWPATRQVPGAPHRLLFENVTFMLDAAGRRCAARIVPYGHRQGPALDAGAVQLPAVATYTIEKTRLLLEETTSSGKRLQASASRGGLPCQLASVGTAGTFATGVVIEGDDLTFQLRNGALTEQCEFRTSPRLEVRGDWAVKEVVWDIDETSLCRGDEFGLDAGNAQVSFFADGRAVFPVRFQAWCNVNRDDLPRNSHVYKARLERVVLVGPPDRNWKDAFN